jgi:hypothetical protein
MTKMCVSVEGGAGCTRCQAANRAGKVLFLDHSMPRAAHSGIFIMRRMLTLEAGPTITPFENSCCDSRLGEEKTEQLEVTRTWSALCLRLNMQATKASDSSWIAVSYCRCRQHLALPSKAKTQALAGSGRLWPQSWVRFLDTSKDLQRMYPKFRRWGEWQPSRSRQSACTP